MDRELEHGAVLRRTDIHPLQLVFGLKLALDEFADLGVDLAHLLLDLTAEILVDLNDLELDFGDLPPGLRDGRLQLGLFAVETGRLPLQQGKAIDLNEVLLEQVANPFELAADQLNFSFLGLLLSRKTDDLLQQLPGLLTQLSLLAQPGGPAQFEQLAFAFHDLRDFHLALPARKLIRKLDRVRTIPFACKARLARRKLGQAFRVDRQVRSGNRLIEAYDNIAGLDAIALANAQLADHPAGGMLHLLDIRIDNDGAWRDQRTREFGRSYPAAHANGKDDKDRQARENMAPDGLSCCCCRRFQIKRSPSQEPLSTGVATALAPVLSQARGLSDRRRQSPLASLQEADRPRRSRSGGARSRPRCRRGRARRESLGAIPWRRGHPDWNSARQEQPGRDRDRARARARFAVPVLPTGLLPVRQFASHSHPAGRRSCRERRRRPLRPVLPRAPHSARTG